MAAARKSTETVIGNHVMRKRCMELRMGGRDLEAIGRELGISKQAVWYHIVKALEAMRAETTDAAQHYRDMQMVRLERMLDKIWHRVEIGDEESIATALKLFDRQAKLMGLDAPQKIAQTNLEGTSLVEPPTDYEFARRVAWLLMRGVESTTVDGGPKDVSPISTDQPSNEPGGDGN